MMKEKKGSPESEARRRLRLFEESAEEILRLAEPGEDKKTLLSRAGAEFIYMELTEDVCRKCPRYRECFGKNKERTLEEIRNILEKAEANMQVRGTMASPAFRKRCVYYQPFMEEISWLFRMLYQNYCWEKRIDGLRQVMYRQIASQRLLISECLDLLTRGTEITGWKKRKLSLSLIKRGFLLSGGWEYTDDGGLLNVNLSLRSPAGARKNTGILRSLSALYHKQFQYVGSDVWVRSGRQTLSFVEEGSFQVLFGRWHICKEGETVCGDTYSLANYNKKRAVMLLSDGMGAGEKAQADSRRLLEAFETMLEAGVNEEYVLEILHNTQLMREKKELATMDAAMISLRTGMLKSMKAGGAATFIRRRDSVERIESEGLPPGSLTRQGFSVQYRKLYDGDMVVMVSDGMLDFESRPGNTLRMETILRGITTRNAQSFADALAGAVPPPETGHDDDRTVLVAAVWEKGRKG